MTSSPEERSSRKAVGAVLAAFAFVSIFCVNIFPRQWGGEFAQSSNELSRYELVVSIVERGSLSIGRELSEFGDHEDKSIYRGRYFSNKAPGLALAGVPVYAVIKAVAGPARFASVTPDFYLIRVLTVSALCFAALVAFQRRLFRTALDPRWVPAIVFAVAFGTPWLIYSRSFFSHAWTASLLYLSFECLHSLDEKPWYPALGGLLAGWAVLSEYPAAIVAGILLVDAVWRRPWRRGAAFIVGVLPPAVILGLYDAACFAGPFDLSSAHEWYQPFSRLSGGHKFFGFALPSPVIAFKLLASPSRGVLAQSPFFAFLPAACAMAKFRGRALRVSIVAAGALFVAMCAYENWHGGWAVGARYLLPVVLLAAWPTAQLAGPVSRAATVIFAASVVYSAVFFFFSGSTFWFYPANPWNGPRFFTAFWLAHGWYVPTLAGTSVVGIGVLAAATLFGGTAALRTLLSRRDDRILAVLGGIAAFSLLFAGSPPRGGFGERLTRLRILEGFTRLDPGRAELIQMGSEAVTATDRAAWERTMRHYAVSR